MKLFTNAASPFARKVRILALEKGIADRITEIAVQVSPVQVNEEIARLNPLVKIPALETDEGELLYDSVVICEYLDSLEGGEPAVAGHKRFATLRLQALADGMLDAAVLCRYEQALRPEAIRWQSWIDGQRQKIFRGLDVLEHEVKTWTDAFDIGQIGVVCVLGYLDFRFSNWDWRQAHPGLSQWYSAISQRPSVALTVPA